MAKDKEEKKTGHRFAMGNNFSVGNEGGRPAFYEDPALMYTKVMEYFEWAETENKGKITITGLVLFLGFESRKSLQQYEDKPEFATIVKRARLAVESYYEEKLTGMSYGGAIFALKNLGAEYWKDKTEQDVNQKITNVNANFGNPIQSASESKDNT